MSNFEIFSLIVLSSSAELVDFFTVMLSFPSTERFYVESKRQTEVVKFEMSGMFLCNVNIHIALIKDHKIETTLEEVWGTDYFAYISTNALGFVNSQVIKNEDFSSMFPLYTFKSL